MKFNFLYIVWLLALIMCFVIVYKFAGQSQHTFFGTAESEGQILNYEYSVLVEKIYVHHRGSGRGFTRAQPRGHKRSADRQRHHHG